MSKATLFLFSFFLLLLLSCEAPVVYKEKLLITTEHAIPEKNTNAIKVPDGYTRVPQSNGTFASYLRKLCLKEDKAVYLYNGTMKLNQSAQYAVLDISIGDKDLQQCADAVMRLRAEYFYEQGKFQQIEFFNGRKEKLNYQTWLNGRQNSRKEFMKYMEHVFNYCGTASLPYSVANKPIHQMQIGDILLKPGSPGHTVMVMDMAQNSNGKKVYLLAQSYMPAQSIHILKNPMDAALSPWYELNNNEIIETPEWTFYSNQLYGWK